MSDDKEHTAAALRHAQVLKLAREAGLLGSKGLQMGGRFPAALVEEAKRVTGFSENTELLTYALAKVAIEDDFGERLVKRRGSVPKGALVAP